MQHRVGLHSFLWYNGSMKQHTLAFIFTPTFDKVLLIEKQKPDWQKGKLNGIGGKHDADESSEECVSRETQEETGLDIREDAWKQFSKIKMYDIDVEVDVYAAVYEGNESDAESREDLPVSWVPVRALPDNVMTNLRIMIPAAVEFLKEGEMQMLTLEYGGAYSEND